MNDKFIGPLFIVGLSRSGTKLIRDLLNRNALISLPDIESQFIPKMLLEDESNIHDWHKKIERTLFIKRFPNKDWPDLDMLNNLVIINNKQDLIESVLKFYAIESHDEVWNRNVIWGDKTPSYLRHLDLLKNYFPTCKFIHIIRDPRNRALSVHKTWGKSMNRATELWRNEISESMKWRNRSECYLDVKYEDLVENTEEVLITICNFLGINYSDEMLKLEKPSEKYGANSKSLNVKNANRNNRFEENQKKIERIEEIAYPMMQKLGYKINYAKKFRPISPYKMFLIKISDFIKFKVSVKIKGY